MTNPNKLQRGVYLALALMLGTSIAGTAVPMLGVSEAKAQSQRLIAAVLFEGNQAFSDSALLAGWSATVSLGGQFSVTQSGQSWTFPASRVKYWSGTATASSGIGLNICLPAQPAAVNAQTLTATRPAYSCGAIASLSSSLTWRPTIVVDTQASDPSGTYSGTITHSVS